MKLYDNDLTLGETLMRGVLAMIGTLGVAIAVWGILSLFSLLSHTLIVLFLIIGIVIAVLVLVKAYLDAQERMNIKESMDRFIDNIGRRG